MMLLEIQNLKHVFPNGKVAFKNINIVINKGEFIVLAGPNGSGKTVFIRHLNGLLKPTEGKVLLHGNCIQKDLINTRKQIGMIFQDPGQQVFGQTVREDIAFGPENLNLSRDEITKRVNNSIKILDLEDLQEAAPYQLSGGEKQRLAIAGVLAMEPSILIFDEPFSNLDATGVRNVLNRIIKLHSEGKTIIIISHDMEKMISHATRMLIMYNGEIAEDGIPSNLIPKLEQYGIRCPYLMNRDFRTLTWIK